MILTLDLGSSGTKVALWDPDPPAGQAGLTAWSGYPVVTAHPGPGRSEQDPDAWWTSLVAACGAVRARAPEAFAAVDVLGCTGARQTMVLVDRAGRSRARPSSGRTAGPRRGPADGGAVRWGGPAPAPTGDPPRRRLDGGQLAWLRPTRPSAWPPAPGPGSPGPGGAVG